MLEDLAAAASHIADVVAAIAKRGSRGDLAAARIMALQHCTDILVSSRGAAATQNGAWETEQLAASTTGARF